MPESRPPYPPAFRRRMVEPVRAGHAAEEYVSTLAGFGYLAIGLDMLGHTLSEAR